MISDSKPDCCVGLLDVFLRRLVYTLYYFNEKMGQQLEIIQLTFSAQSTFFVRSRERVKTRKSPKKQQSPRTPQKR